MKPTISETDFQTLRDLIIKQPNSIGKSLGEEITQALVVEEKEMDSRTVRLNSYVDILDMTTKKNIRMQIVLPDFADLKERRISVFAPISVALLGFKERDTISWKMREVETQYKIVKVLNE